MKMKTKVTARNYVNTITLKESRAKLARNAFRRIFLLLFITSSLFSALNAKTFNQYDVSYYFKNTEGLNIASSEDFIAVSGLRSSNLDGIYNYVLIFTKNESGAYELFPSQIRLYSNGNPTILPLAMDGDYLVVGDPGNDRVHIFKWGNVFFDKVKWFDGQENSMFGNSVDIYQNKIVIGAPNEIDGITRAQTGAVYRSDLINETWSDLNKITHPVQNIPSSYWLGSLHFGYDVEINDNTISVSGKHGAAWTDGNLNFLNYVFILDNTNDYTELHKFKTEADYTDVFLDQNERFLIVGEATENGRANIFDLSLRESSKLVDSKKELKSSAPEDFFGNAVGLFSHSLPGNRKGYYAAVGVPGAKNGTDSKLGAIYMYKYENDAWIEQPYDFFYPDPQYPGENFAKDLCFGDGLIMASVRQPKNSSFYTINLAPKPISELEVSKNEFSDSIHISWEKYNSGNVDGFRIYDQNDVIIYDTSGTKSIYDPASPDVVKMYKVAPYNIFGEAEYSIDFGKTKSSREISGKVKALEINGGGGIGDAYLRTRVSTRAFEFVNTSKSLVNKTMNSFPADSFTYEVRFKTEADYLVPFRYGASGKHYLLISLTNKDSIKISMKSEGGMQDVLSYVTPYADDLWHHLAVSWENQTGKVQCFFDGELAAQNSGILIGEKLRSNLDEDHDIYTIGSTNSLIDEMRIWKCVRSADEIKRYYNAMLSGKEKNLVSYWNFDQADDPEFNYILDNIDEKTQTTQSNELEVINGSIVPVLDDQLEYIITSSSEKGANLGNFSFVDIKGTGTDTFRVIPDTIGQRSYNPPLFDVILNDAQPAKANLIFEDLSVFTIRGSITHANLLCPLKNVPVAIIGENSLDLTDIDTVLTNAEGIFESTMQSGTYIFKPIYPNHIFDKDSIILDVKGSSEGLLDFTDITTFKLSGKVVSGSCDYPLGKTDLIVKFPASCIDSIINITTTTDAKGIERYEIELPALQSNYFVQVSEVDNENWDLIGTGTQGYFEKTKSVNLAENDSIIDFVYHTEPKLVITYGEFPGADCDIPVLEQYDYYDFTFRLQEEYEVENEIQVCPVTTPYSLTIFDDIGDQKAIKIRMDSSDFRYKITAGSPNIVNGGNHPHQKKFQIIAEVDFGGNTEYTEWVYVAGVRPREKTFATVSPQIPFMILRDPPGDASFSSISQSNKECFTTSLAIEKDASLTNSLTLNVGTKFTLGAFGYHVETEIKNKLTPSLEAGVKLVSTNETEFCITTTSDFSTSNRALFIGDKGDVFVGAALNIVYALTDVLEIIDCTPVMSKSIIYGLNGDGPFTTEYSYSEYHIKNSIIPKLQEISLIGDDEEKKQRAKDQIEVWKQTLDYNDELKANAYALNSFSGGNNISLDPAGAPRTYTFETSVKESRKIDFNMYINASVARDVGVVIGGVGTTWGQKVKASWNRRKSESQSSTNITKTSFTLSDDDRGDALTLDVKIDPVYGTPVFDVLTGDTRCPFEPGTLPREGVQLTIDKNLVTGLDPDELAVFTLNLGNIGQSGENLPYELVFLQESNPDGIELRLGGSEVQGGIPVPYTIPALSSINAILTAERGPIAYNYEDLKLVLRSTCDKFQIADTVLFSVNYNTPCSELTLFRPENGWIVNNQSKNQLKVVLSDYNIDLLNSISLQFSDRNKNSWETSTILAKDELGDDFTITYIDTKNMPDGEFDLRAVIECDGGVFYTAKSYGVIDRQAPALFGNPSPSNGRYDSESSLSMRFAEDINCITVTSENIIVTNKNTGEEIKTTVICDGREVLINPVVNLSAFEGQTLTVIVNGIADLNDNALTSPLEWSFLVSTNSLFMNPVIFTKSIVKDSPDTEGIIILSNSGTSPAEVTVTDLPSWMEVSETTFTILAGKDKVLKLNSDVSGLSLSEYKETITISNGEGDLKLPVIITVREAPPVSMPISSSGDSIQVFAGIYQNNYSLGDENDILYAYSNDELRGSATLIKLFPWSEFLADLKVFGNDSESISFKLWDASEAKMYNIGETIVFKVDSSFGVMNADSGYVFPLSIDGLNAQYIAISEGWSWISTYMNTDNVSLKDQLSSLTPIHGSVIKGQHSFSQYVEGKGWVGKLSKLEIGNGYKINVFEAGELIILGEKTEPNLFPDYNLSSGWNWIGGTMDKLLFDTVFDLPKEDIASLYSGSTVNSYNQEWSGPIDTIYPGYGYSYYNSNSSDLQWYEGSTSNKSFSGNIKRSMNGKTVDVYSGLHQNTMTMVGEIAIAGELADNNDVYIQAFDSKNRCVGFGEPMEYENKWIYFMTVYGNINDVLQLKVYDANKDLTLMVREPLLFVVDQIHGNPSAPVLWEVGTEEIKTINNAPIDIFISNTNVQTSSANNEAFAVISAEDRNPGDDHTFSLVSGDGDTDNELFKIAGELLMVQSPSSISKSELSIRIRAEDKEGLYYEKGFVLSVDKITSIIVKADKEGLKVSQNYPNPFSDFTVVDYSIPSAGNVTFEIYNSMGVKVHSEAYLDLLEGNHSITFTKDGLAMGLYYYRIVFNNRYSILKKMILR